MPVKAVERILIAEGLKQWRERYAKILGETFPEAEIIETDRANEALMRCRREQFDLVVIGEQMENSDGVTVIRMVRQTRKDLVILFLGARQARCDLARKQGATLAIWKDSFATKPADRLAALHELKLLA